MVPHAYGLKAMSALSQRWPTPIEHFTEIAAVAIGERMEKTVLAVEQRARPGEARLRHARGTVAGLRCPARMHALRPRAFGEVLDDARRHASGDAEGIEPLGRVERQRRGHPRRRTQRAEHRGGMKAGLVHALGRHEAQPAHHFAPDRDAAREVVTCKRMLLGSGENGRNDHGACMHRAAFEGIVVVLAVRGGAVAQRRRGDVEATRMADQRTRSGLAARGAASPAHNPCDARPHTGRRRPSARRRTSASRRRGAFGACRRTPPPSAPKRR